MAAPERFSIVAPLDPLGGWRRALALDRGPGTPRAVVLAFVPDEISGDAARLGAVLRDVEAAGRLHHPGALSVLGTETVGGALAVVEPYRAGTSLRAVLDAGGRLPADLAARVVVEACAAIGKAHALDGGDGKPLVHGSIDCARIAVSEDGAALVSGFAQNGRGDVAGDVRALAAVLHELLTGDRPAPAAPPADAGPVPEALARAVARGLGAAPGEPFPSALALAEAVAAAGPVASRDAVAAYVEAILPRVEAHPPALRSALEAGPPSDADAEEVAAENLIVEPTDPAVRTPPRAFAPPRPAHDAVVVEPTDPTVRTPPRAFAPPRPAHDAAGTFRAPQPARRRSRLPLAVAAVCGAVGFGGGFAAARLAPEFAPPAPAAAAVPEPPLAAPTSAAVAPARPARAAAPAPVAKATKSAKGTKPSRRGGKAAKAERAADRAEAPETAAVAAPAGGTLDVSAPPDADVFLDGRRIGRGSLRTPVAEGPHEIEVRRGPERVAERFSVSPGETFTYSVAPVAPIVQ